MTFPRCQYTRHVAPYVACSLDDTQAESLDGHLEQCDECRQTLASVIEGGVGPEWLSWCREPSVPEESLDDEASESREASIDNEPSEIRSADLRYQRIRQVGAGGMGVVWEGWDTVMRRRVALKELLPRAAGARRNDATQNRGLLQEASSLARLSHPNIVSVYELFMTDGWPTMVMEFIDGPTLSQWRGDRIIAERQAAMMLERLANASQHAHENGVIHRDLKPSNVLLSFPRDQRDVSVDLNLATPKLSDFGLSRIEDDPGLTLAGDLIGTPAFMAPEQARGDVALIGPATDVYGLGAMLYDLLTGTAPHVAEDPIATLERVRNHEPISPRLLRPELSKDIETICLKCLRKTPTERYPSAAALAADLRAYLDGRAIVARPQSQVAIVAKWCRRHKLLTGLLVTATVLLIMLVIGAIVFARTEQALRKKAEAAVSVADAATQRVQEHFRVTMGAVDNITHLLNMTASETNGIHKELAERLRIDAIVIYGEFLESLPEDHLWTFRDINVAIRHAELSAELSPEGMKESRRRLEALLPVMEGLERDHATKPETLLLLHWYARTLGNCSARDGDPLAAAPWYAKQARCIQQTIDQNPEDVGQLREHCEVLFTASLCYSQGRQLPEALRIANLSAEAAKRLVDKLPETEEERFRYLHKLGWVGTVAFDLGNEEELRRIHGEVSKICDSFEEASPMRKEIDSIKAHITELSEKLAKRK